ncbi:uncharacterized protein ARMOST_16017 [Armillaria ostoyae]|uniref:Uncharacterized protein n=1 Tax=Armillaria ostoyae TaxID=47428 RepID=A0A284RV01_ARMOS|nr:uncharacterized protein ARMOST_16017 [Armillaria ostoyae]
MSSKVFKDLRNACSPLVALPQTYGRQRPYYTVGLEVFTASARIPYTEAVFPYNTVTARSPTDNYPPKEAKAPSPPSDYKVTSCNLPLSIDPNPANSRAARDAQK